MSDVDVDLVCEHAARELDVACAVMHLAESRYGVPAEVLPLQTGARWMAP